MKQLQDEYINVNYEEENKILRELHEERMKRQNELKSGKSE